MRIANLRIENFRRFKLVDLELPDGVIGLVGRNGAGKSTLLEAIGWCLFGNEAARTGKDLIKRRGAAPGDDVRVHLQFTLGAHAYAVTRELLGKSGSHVATILVDGAVVVSAGAKSSAEATAFVERLFHMDRQAFFTSLVARQRELNALTDAKASERKRVLISLLRLDAVDVAIQNARAQKRDLRNELSGIRVAAKDPQAIAKQLESVRAALETDARRLAEADARVADLVEQVETARERRDAGRKVHEAYRHATLAIAGVEHRVQSALKEEARLVAELERAARAGVEAEQLAQRIVELPAARALLERQQALRIRHEEGARVRRELDEASRTLAQGRVEIETATAALAGASAARALNERAAAQRARFETTLQEAVAKEGALQARAQEAARTLADLDAKAKRVRDMGPDSPCPTCTRPLHEHHGKLLHDFGAEADAHRKALAQIVPEREAATAAVGEARGQLKALAQREAELRDKLATLAREEARLEAAKRSVVEAEARVARLDAQAKALQDEPYDAKQHEAMAQQVRTLEAVQQKHTRLAAEAERGAEASPQLETARAALAEARADLARATHDRDALAFDAPAHDAIEKQAEQAERVLGEARLARERSLNERARRLDEEKRLQEEHAEHTRLAERARALESRVQLLERLAADRDGGLLPDFKDHLISRIRPLLSLHAGKLFRELTEGRYADLEVDEAYDILIHDDGEAFGLQRFSGGESDLANLCLRLAVSQVVAERAGLEGLGFLALDEVFGSQDEVRKGNILRALKALSSRFRQIVLITHVDDVKHAVDHVLRVEESDEGSSRIVVEAA